MRVSLRALNKAPHTGGRGSLRRARSVQWALVLALFAPALHGETRWYHSNAAGMALEPAFSRLALRGKYALSIEPVQPKDIPDLLKPYHNPGLHAERYTLYENGAASRERWLFRDEAGRSRLASAFEISVPEEETEEPPWPEGFIERYDENRRITEELQLASDGSVRIIVYRYAEGTLVSAEARLKLPPAGETGEASEEKTHTDYYRYSRSASLRAVERVFHQDQTGAETPPVRLVFPHMVLSAAKNSGFVDPRLAYSSGFIEDILMEAGSTVVYTTDDRGRVLRETRRDEEGTVQGELWNTWSGDRLVSVRWKSGDDERLTEYEYDAEGDRILERNYRQGVLERTVRSEGGGESGREVEELYMDGQVILRAFWEGGRKVREEQVRPAPEAAP